jgi:uncharacterized protein (DUF2384 family)
MSPWKGMSMMTQREEFARANKVFSVQDTAVPQELLTTREVIRLAIRIFGDVAKTRAWMSKPDPCFGGAPEELLGSPEGRLKVQAVLRGIEKRAH